MLKRVNAHAERRELSTSVLGDSSNSPIIQIQESKVDVQFYVLFIFISAHRHFVVFKVLHIILQFFHKLDYFALQQRQVIGVGVPYQ